jgi:hypothetical protein
VGTAPELEQAAEELRPEAALLARALLHAELDRLAVQLVGQQLETLANSNGHAAAETVLSRVQEQRGTGTPTVTEAPTKVCTICGRSDLDVRFDPGRRQRRSCRDQRQRAREHRRQARESAGSSIPAELPRSGQGLRVCGAISSSRMK